MGGAMLDDDVLTYIAGTDCYLDTSFSIHDLPKRAAEQIIEKHGAERILFGSDCPWSAHATRLTILIRSLYPTIKRADLQHKCNNAIRFKQII